MSEHTVAYKLFKFLFEVRVPAFALIPTKGRVRYFTPDSPADADAQLNRPTFTRLTIPQLAEMYVDGVMPEFVDINRLVVAYGLIIEHLTNWHQVIVNDPHDVDIPEDDLMTLDEFARFLFPFVKSSKLIDINTDNRVSRLDSFLYGRRGTPDLKEARRKSLSNEYKSIGDDIAKAAVNRRRSWSRR